MNTFKLKIVVPEKPVFDGEAEKLLIRTTEGEITFLAGHTDYLEAIGVGYAKITRDGKTRSATCVDGFVSVSGGEVSVVVTNFEFSDEIDVKRAEAAKQKAEEILRISRDDREISYARAKLARAVNRITLAQTK